MSMRYVLVASVLVTACEKSVATPTSRTAWFAAVDAYVASPGRAQLTALLDSDVWRSLPRDAFAKDPGEVVRFFPATKMLIDTVRARGTVDDVLRVALFNLDAYQAILLAADDFIAALPADDPTRSVRVRGTDKMRLGAAIELAGTLYVTLDPSLRRDEVLARLASPATYATFSREGLQLLVATLDERVLPMVEASRRAAYVAVRDTIAKEHARRPEPSSDVRTTYQGVDGTTLGPARIVSTTGKFSVELTPGALAKRVELAPGIVQHWIELQDGEARFEAACFDGVSDASVVAQLRGTGAIPTDMGEPGTWLALDRDGRASRIRVLPIAGRACFAALEGPAASFSFDRADAFLRSLRAEP